MKLTDLNPKLKGTLADGTLRFDCPHPGCNHQVRVAISDKPYHERPVRTEEMQPWAGTMFPGRIVKVWQASGEFPEMVTLTPSINTRCWHGSVTNGEVT